MIFGIYSGRGACDGAEDWNRVDGFHLEPGTGCTRVSPGCDHCYAAILAARLLGPVYRARPPVVDSDLTRRDPFSVRLWPERLSQPYRWREARMIFVNSMSDAFHADIPDDFVRAMFQTMTEASWHTYQVLTKRPTRALRFWQENNDLFSGGPIPEHIWIGTSVEDDAVAHRVRHLQAVPVTVRFLSCEPLIGPLDPDLEGIHWVIAGGESGPVRRPMKEERVRVIRDRCRERGVPFFFKQWGGRTPKAGGRELDGEFWDGIPGAAVEEAG